MLESIHIAGFGPQSVVMAGRHQRFAVLLVLSTSALLCAPCFADQQHKTHKATPKKEVIAPQPAPVVPPPGPPTPEQMPAIPAQVTYQNNQLTILARNSTVGDILRAVHKQTGASVDAPPNAAQRVVGQFGPGPARDVLASVLDASGFNYVLLGSATNPNALQNVIVTVKSNEPSSPAAQQQQPQDNSGQADDDNQPPEADQPEQNQPSESFAPQESDSNSSSSDDQSSQDQQSNVKTPEQLLQELQRQQQLQQMQQRQQNQGGQQPDSSTPQNQMQQIQR